MRRRTNRCALRSFRDEASPSAGAAGTGGIGQQRSLYCNGFHGRRRAGIEFRQGRPERFEAGCHPVSPLPIELFPDRGGDRSKLVLGEINYRHGLIAKRAAPKSGQVSSRFPPINYRDAHSFPAVTLSQRWK